MSCISQMKSHWVFSTQHHVAIGGSLMSFRSVGSRSVLFSDTTCSILLAHHPCIFQETFKNKNTSYRVTISLQQTNLYTSNSNLLSKISLVDQRLLIFPPSL
jgi:hypothetical protein